MPIYADKKNGKPTGRWRVEVTVKGQRLRDRCDTYAQAEAAEEKFKTQLENGEAPQAKRKFDADRSRPENLDEAIQRAEGRLWVGKSSETTAFAHLNTVKELMGNPKLDEIDTVFIDDLITLLEAQPKIGADSTINRYLSHFHTFLTWCKDRNYRTLELPKFAWKDEDEGRIRWVTHAEEEQLQKILPPWCWKLVRIAIRSGMRRGEILSVVPEQISPGWVHLWKTKSGYPRSVPLTPEDEADLRWLAGEGSNDGTRPMPTPSALRHAWNTARETMGLKDDPWFVFHACRHTCATRLVMKNVNLRVIKEFLGHKRIETTLRYAHVNDQLLTNALHVLMGTGQALPAFPATEMAMAA